MLAESWSLIGEAEKEENDVRDLMARGWDENCMLVVYAGQNRI
jgi:hypothetical protein